MTKYVLNTSNKCPPGSQRTANHDTAREGEGGGDSVIYISIVRKKSSISIVRLNIVIMSHGNPDHIVPESEVEGRTWRKCSVTAEGCVSDRRLPR